MPTAGDTSDGEALTRPVSDRDTGWHHAVWAADVTTPSSLRCSSVKRDTSISTDGHYQGRISTPDVIRAAAPSTVHRTDPCVLPVVSGSCREDPNQRRLIRAHTSGQDDPRVEALAGLGRSIGPRVERRVRNAARHTSPRWGISLPGVRIPGPPTRPPLNAFSSMVSLGYSLLYKNIIGAISVTA